MFAVQKIRHIKYFSKLDFTTLRTIAMANNSKEIELQLPLGCIKGLERTTIYDDVYNSFEGVPYAQPPIGELRFKAPLPAEPWSGVRDCRDFQTVPMQTDGGCEDCLYLNVYAKTFNSKKPLPVMVFIYGGGFRKGDCTRAHYGPDYFMFEDVVLVVPNYRLCSLGFLSLADPACQVPGNAGLKDQLLALQWTKQYIKYFNGDENNITLFGESAGSVSVHLLHANKQSKGLFHKAIMMSGTGFNTWGCAPHGDLAYRLAKLHGYQGANTDKCVLEHLQQLQPKQLVNHALLNHKDLFNGRILSFTPTIEPYASDKCMMDKTILEMLKTTWANDIPVMLGGTTYEGLVLNPFVRHVGCMEEAYAQPELLLPVEVKSLHTTEELKIMGDTLKKLYFSENSRETEPALQLLDLFSYKFFWHGIHRAVLSRLEYARAPTYLYRFDFDSEFFNFYRTQFIGPNTRGVSHADDLGYLFLLRKAHKLEQDTPEFQTIKRMVGIWTSFAKNSNPNCAEIAPNNWQPVSKTAPYKVLNIGSCVEIMDMPEKEKLEAWNNFYSKAALYKSINQSKI